MKRSISITGHLRVGNRWVPTDTLGPVKKKENQGDDYVEFPEPKWVPPHQGQQTYCGWTKEGQKAFKDYTDANKLARKDDSSKLLEAAVLPLLKEKNKKALAPSKAKGNKKQDDGEEIITLEFD